MHIEYQQAAVSPHFPRYPSESTIQAHDNVIEIEIITSDMAPDVYIRNIAHQRRKTGDKNEATNQIMRGSEAASTEQYGGVCISQGRECDIYPNPFGAGTKRGLDVK